MKENKNIYNFFRLASCSPKLQVSNTIYNSNKIIENIRLAEKNDVDIIVFPELSISSYSAADLFNTSNLTSSAEKSLNFIIKETNDLNIVSIIGLPIRYNSVLYNCAVVIYYNKIMGIVPKSHLCNYNEYYEERWFTSGKDLKSQYIIYNDEKIPFGVDLVFQFGSSDLKFAIEICEDLWAVNPPSDNYIKSGANVIFNLSASDEYLGKVDYRKQLISSTSSRQINAYIYASAGANESSTDLSYSGFCGIFENGKLLKEGKRFSFESEMIIADIDIELINNTRQKNKTFCSNIIYNSNFINIDIIQKYNRGEFREIRKSPFLPRKNNEEEFYSEILQIQSTALAKRLLHINCKDIVIGISGGLDSTWALFVAMESFKKLNYDISGIHAITMPGFGTSKRTKSNALDLIKKMGVSTYEISIKKSVELHLDDISYDGDRDDIVFENAQARERTQILMDYANKVGGIAIGTGDLSELALGWCTYNADQMSMYNVNSGLPKTLIPFVLKWHSNRLNNNHIVELINDIINTPISPELLPLGNDEKQQSTEATLGKYELHDFYLFYFIRLGFGIKKIFWLAKLAFREKYSNEELINTLETFIRRFFKSQFKRTAMPDGPKIGTVSLSPRGDWRMPSDVDYKIWKDKIKELRKEYNLK